MFFYLRHCSLRTNCYLLAFHFSYFGPAYAKATKTQRAIQLSDNLLVIENQTQLADIPYADRFLVVERWIVEAVNNEKLNQQHDFAKRPSRHDMALYTSKLSVYAEVIMLKSCAWEAQIQTKASETFTDSKLHRKQTVLIAMNFVSMLTIDPAGSSVVTDWCRTATKALEATEEHKQKRLKLSGDSSMSKSTKHKLSEAPIDKQHFPPADTKGSELIARHRRNFRELDKLIAKGDLECIEVIHSSTAGKQSAFARVLESNPADAKAGLSESLTEETETTDCTEGSRRVSVATKRKSRNFLRLIGSRMNKSVGDSVKPR